MVYDVAAEDGGGLFVLKKFYEDVIKLQSHDIEWTFLVSTNEIQPQKNIEIIRNNQIKKSYVYRIQFELFELPGIIKRIQPDLIISLQNAPIGHCKVRQFVYLHQSLQYCPKKFSFLRAEERKTAFRQHIICNLYKIALPKSDHIFVQTEWIKKATMHWIHCSEEKITIVPVAIDTSMLPTEKYCGQNARIFFYPARAEMYKNHKVVIDACRILIQSGCTNFKVLFTVTENDGAYAAQLVEKSKGLPIDYIGAVDYKDIWKYYGQSILLYPSYLETCGLPMLEARNAGSRILASDMPFSHEALDGYPNAAFFKYDDPIELANKMRAFLDEPKYVFSGDKKLRKQKSLLNAILERM